MKILILSLSLLISANNNKVIFPEGLVFWRFKYWTKWKHFKGHSRSYKISIIYYFISFCFYWNPSKVSIYIMSKTYTYLTSKVNEGHFHVYKSTFQEIPIMKIHIYHQMSNYLKGHKRLQRSHSKSIFFSNAIWDIKITNSQYFGAFLSYKISIFLSWDNIQ